MYTFIASIFFFRLVRNEICIFQRNLGSSNFCLYSFFYSAIVVFGETCTLQQPFSNPLATATRLPDYQDGINYVAVSERKVFHAFPIFSRRREVQSGRRSAAIQRNAIIVGFFVLTRIGHF